MQIKKYALRNPIKDTEDENNISVVPPQFAATSRQRPYQVLSYLSSVTGTPVASYLKVLSFSALLTEGIREGRPICLAPTGNSLYVLSNLLISAQSHLLECIIPLYTDKVNSFFEKIFNFYFRNMCKSISYNLFLYG